MKQALPFRHPYRHDFVRVAVAVPRIRVADPAFNAAATVAMLERLAAEGASLVAFPELGLAAYTSDDLFHQRALLDACEAALATVAEATARIPITAVVGLPLRVDHLLFNCAAVVSGGRVQGVVPKTYLPNYGEFYEARQFTGADDALAREATVGGVRVPFGNQLLFAASNLPLLRFHAEICEDLWVPIPPSCYAALAGATVLVNLSASNITIGKADYRHQLVGQQSARCQAVCLYTSAGVGESSTDLAWDGQGLIYEAGELLAESERFANGSHFITADVDLERVSRERMRQNTFGQSVGRARSQLEGFRTIAFEMPVPATMPMALRRRVERFPYVPADPKRRDERCAEVYSIQVQALVQRLSASGIDKVVIGISGGLDSTHALLVCARAMDLLGRPRSNVLAWTMPGFATSERTLDQARRLMRSVGCTAGEIDIRPSCRQMLADIGHPYAEGRAEYDITFENVQAGERTSHLFRLANFHGGVVVGTGDLSELALGWSTYGVGDHMSHYNVNASVPKTLVKHLVRWVAGNGSMSVEASRVLEEIVATEVSPELVPGDANQKPAQSSEDAVGPYELQDFHLHQILRYGYAPSKVAFLAWTAWQDSYSLAEIKKHLRNFLYRFFKTSQFKRSCVPNAPKVGSGGSLSPRGDWRAPSDSEATAWLDELASVPDE
ncbi:MAG: NAD(+) synthase [Caldimonas sp.]